MIIYPDVIHIINYTYIISVVFSDLTEKAVDVFRQALVPEMIAVRGPAVKDGR